MLIKTRIGKAKIASLMIGQDWFLGVGAGEASWGTNPPQFAYDDTSLVAPYGLLRARQKGFVAEVTDLGDIQLQDGSFWNFSQDPTPYLYAAFSLEMPELQGVYIRELALHLDATAKPDVPQGQNFLSLDDVENFGDLIALDSLPEVYREGATRQTFSVVVSF